MWQTFGAFILVVSWSKWVLRQPTPWCLVWGMILFTFVLIVPPFYTPSLLELVTSVLFTCDDATLGVVGNFLIWLSMCVPYYHYREYGKLKARILKSSFSKKHPKRLAFCKGDDQKGTKLDDEEYKVQYGSDFMWDAYDKKKRVLMEQHLNSTVVAAEDDMAKEKDKKGKQPQKLHSRLESVWECKEDKKFLNVCLGPTHE